MPLLIIMSISGTFGSLINTNEDNKEPFKILEEHRPRSKRSLATLLDAWIGTIAVTGLRISYFPEEWYYDIFGDKKKEAREQLDKIIADEHEQHRTLVKTLNQMTIEYEDQKSNSKENLELLKNQYKEDFKDALEVVDKKKLLKVLCGDTYCKEYFIRDLVQDAD